MADLKDMLKGSLFIFGGIVLLLNTLNILKESLNYILIIGSIVMILYGLLKTGIWEFIAKLISSTTKKTQ